MSTRADWRQGFVISITGATATLVNPPLLENEKLVVITHDCDIQNQQELTIDLIRANVIAAPEDDKIHSRHPRELHLNYQSATSVTVLSLTHAARITINANTFLQFTPDINLTLQTDQKRTLKQWLAARYSRPAFPDCYQQRIDNKIGKYLKDKLKRVPSVIIGIYVDLHNNIDKELPEGSPYPISLYLVYNSEEGPAARTKAEELATAFTNKFIAVYGKPSDATEIALEECKAISEEKFSLYDIRRKHQWRLEYMSLRDDNDAVLLHENN